MTADEKLTNVAELAGVSVRSIRRVEGELEVSHVDNEAERESRRIGRPSKAEPFRPFVVEQLAKEPELLSLEILRRAKLEGHAGGKRALYELVHAVDEVGYLTYRTDAANMLFHVVNDRHRRKRSMIFTTSKALAAWGHVLPRR